MYFYCSGIVIFYFLENFSFSCHLLIFFKINFFEKFFQEYHQSDLDQSVCKGYEQTSLVGNVLTICLIILSNARPDLDPNFFPEKKQG